MGLYGEFNGDEASSRGCYDTYELWQIRKFWNDLYELSIIFATEDNGGEI